MGRVSRETIQKLNAFLDTLPDEAQKKCALCNETLTHIVKHAEATVQAGTATVTRVLAERINKNSAPHDRVSGSQLRDRVRIKEGVKRQNNKVDLIPNNHSAPSVLPPQPPKIAAISNGHYDTDKDGNTFPVRDPALCSENLTHIVKQAEVKTGAGTATVTRELPD